MSDSVQPHRRPPTKLLCPWDSPGKNTGVDCHFLLQCMKVISESEVAQSSPTLSDLMDCSLPGSSIHGIFQARVLEWVQSPSPYIVRAFFINHLDCCALKSIPMFTRRPWFPQVALLTECKRDPKADLIPGDAGDVGSIPGSGRSPGGGHGSPLQYSCPVDREPGGL